MKTAKEMFEALGYELQTQEQLNQQKETFKTIRYLHKNNECIDFYLDCGQVASFILKTEGVMAITMKEFKAIQQQLKELGWLDE